MTWTQASVMRAVKAALEPARKMGLSVTGYKVTFVQGVPCVDVTLGPESAPSPPAQTGGPNVEELKAHLIRAQERRHAARRS